MINILRTLFFILAPIGIIFLVGYSGSENEDRLTYFPVERESNIANDIDALKEKVSFRDVSIFAPADDAVNDRALMEFAADVSKMQIESSSLNTLYSEKPAAINFNIPSEKGNVKLVLERVNILDGGFRFTSNDGGTIIKHNYTPGIHYRGIIEGDNRSIAAISVFPGFVMGIISNEEGNFNLGSVKDANGNHTSEYIYYNDVNVLDKKEFNCGVDDYDPKFRVDNPNVNNAPLEFDNNSGLADTIRVYFECDFAMYQNNGSNLNATGQYVEGMFNAVSTIYRNESLPTSISEVRVHTQTDPYTNTTNSFTVLESFGHNTQDNFYGDLAHFLSGRNIQAGGVAWINVLCVPYQSQQGAGRYAYSNIENNNSLPYPVYSWPVNVVAHEMGHNVGSNHTHACVWPVFGPSSRAAIDSCYDAEGNCFNGRRPRLNGTIMSYCHLEGSVSLAAGFGPLPGDTIRHRYQQAGCLQQSTNISEPEAFFLDQNFPNPFNPGTNIRFELPMESIITLSVFDISGREVAKLVNGEFRNSGSFTYYFDAARFSLASGVYFYRINALDPSNSQNNFTQVKKMILIK
ncbi:MAG TPA: M12 family metallo-peptidase [Ignavibacteria bacterium]|nr:M12 family metallo-peptidase [Ignavibacteria bacterium]